MSIQVSQSVYNALVAQRDAATTNATNCQTVITTETANKAAYEAQAADLTEIINELVV